MAGTPNHPLDSQLVAGGSKRCQGRRDVGPSGLGTPRRRLRQPRPESGSMRGLRRESYGVAEKSQEKGSSAYEPQPLLTWTNLPRRTRAGDPPSRPTGPGQIGAANPFQVLSGSRKIGENLPGTPLTGNRGDSGAGSRRKRPNPRIGNKRPGKTPAELLSPGRYTRHSETATTPETITGITAQCGQCTAKFLFVLHHLQTPPTIIKRSTTTFLGTAAPPDPAETRHLFQHH